VTLIVEAGDAREVHHFATLIGYGASAVHPYVALDSLPSLRELGLVEDAIDDAALEKRYLKAVEKGVVKVMSKMGISTIASYRGAQIFEAVGISSELIERYFTLTPSRVGGVGIRELAVEALMHHSRAYKRDMKRALPIVAGEGLDVGGQYQWRREGEIHLFDPETIFKLQHATRNKRYEIFKEYTQAVDVQQKGRVTLRSLLGFKTEGTKPIPLSEVEPIESILPRFQTGAMSYGSISAEAHETLAIAMNRIGARSNSGEGGEDPRRFRPDANGDSRRSAIKQVASARFGVTSAYLVNADELQIKVAQGAKPGEGGQLPGSKVYPWIAEVRHSTAGVGLISPPPHHDIYSIEDLAELIYDLKNANPRARVSVKLVAEVGVGTVAAGVAKAKSDAILISGHDGGTGASPLTSLKHAGVPWELGLAEAQQTLVMNRLRDRVRLAVDGQLKTGRDVIIATLLGAEEFGFATAPLVVLGCIMMRVCHLDTCPVGIATQNPALREKFAGRAEHVVSFFRFVAEEMREIMASLGARTLEELVGRVDLLESRVTPDHFKAKGVDLSKILDASHLGAAKGSGARDGTAEAPRPRLHHAIQQRHGLELALDNKLIALAEPALWRGETVTADLAIENVHRAVGTMLGSELTRRYGEPGLPDGTISFTFRGSAGQSFGAFLPRGIALRLEGDANDYVGKGLSGGRVVVTPSAGSGFVAEDNVIAGNVLLYGATGGEMFVRGIVGERFAVRNSGARAVVEGVGDHGCEYMTGGVVVVLGRTGRNFAAGMSGGVAYLFLDRAADSLAIEELKARVNMGMVDVDLLDEGDQPVLLALLERHAELTGSEAASRLLADRSGVAGRFAKIIPHDEKRVRAERTKDRERALAVAAPRADAAE
jgi:glutamate synthase domain-containing protein 2/glutamate synthase domain-containing protein 3